MKPITCIAVLAAAACASWATTARADSGGAVGLGIDIVDSSYSLGFGGSASVILQNATFANSVRWYEGGDGTSGVAWNNAAVTVALGSGDIVVSSFPIASGTVLNAAFFAANYTSANGVPYGQWTGGVNTVTSANGVCADGIYGFPYGCVSGLANLYGTHPIGGLANPPSNQLLYGVSFTSGAKTAYGWFSVGIAPTGSMPTGYVDNTAAGSYAVANDPVYRLTLNGYGYSTDSTVLAGIDPVPEPSQPTLFAIGLVGILLVVPRKLRRAT